MLFVIGLRLPLHIRVKPAAAAVLSFQKPCNCNPFFQFGDGFHCIFGKSQAWGIYGSVHNRFQRCSSLKQCQPRCGYVAKGNIDLTWWPLFRDSRSGKKWTFMPPSTHMYRISFAFNYLYIYTHIFVLYILYTLNICILYVFTCDFVYACFQ